MKILNRITQLFFLIHPVISISIGSFALSVCSIQMNVHEYCPLIEQSSFYEGSLQHPIHQLLKVPIYIVRIAHLITSNEQKALANSPKKQLVVFSEDQIKLFHVLQLMASNYIKKRKLKVPIPSQKIYLSPNLILPIEYDVLSNKNEAAVSTNESIEQLLDDPDLRQASLPTEKLRGWIEKCLHSSSDIPTTSTAIKGLCQDYEALVIEMREKYEAIIQATNLKLFIKETQVDTLEEKLRKMTAIAADATKQDEELI